MEVSSSGYDLACAEADHLTVTEYNSNAAVLLECSSEATLGVPRDTDSRLDSQSPAEGPTGWEHLLQAEKLGHTVSTQIVTVPYLGPSSPRCARATRSCGYLGRGWIRQKQHW